MRHSCPCRPSASKRADLRSASMTRTRISSCTILSTSCGDPEEKFRESFRISSFPPPYALGSGGALGVRFARVPGDLGRAEAGGTMKRYAFSLGFIGLLVVASSPVAFAHTKGLTLSRFGLIDVSLQANVTYANFDDPKRVDFDKIGDRHSKRFNLTSFDLSLSGQVPEFPLQFAMFLTFEQDKASIEEAFLFFHKLEEFSPVLAAFQATVGQFRSKFGQFNQIHDHASSLPEPPFIHTKFLGVDGVHLLGAEVTYQVPIPYFLQFSLSVQSKGALDVFPAATSST